MDEDEDEDSLPLYGTRLACAKMFLELGDPQDALEIVEGLLLEAEDDPELYYLMAVATADDSERTPLLQLALAKLEAAERKGETDLEPLKRTILQRMNAQ